MVPRLCSHYTKPGIADSSCRFRFAPPNTDMNRCPLRCQQATSLAYSITSSAKADSDAGIVRLSNLAVRMLIRNDK
jgi:hypothetical protein